MANITVEFANDNKSFTVTDLTDHTLITSDEINLEITYPDIATSTLIELDAYPENNATKGYGKQYTFVIATEALLGDLIDGVYKFKWIILNASVSQDETSQYFVNDNAAIKACFRKKTNALLDDCCPEDWCEVGSLVALLESAKQHASEDKFTEAQEIIDYIADKCNGC